MTERTEDDIEARVTALETHLAHQSRQAEELEEVVRRQWDELDMLKARLNAALRRLAELGDDAGTPEANRKPPHW